MKKRGIRIFMLSCMAVVIGDIALLVFEKLTHNETLLAITGGISLLSTAGAMFFLLRSGLVKE